MAAVDSFCFSFTQHLPGHNLLAAFPSFSSPCFYMPKEATRKGTIRRKPGLGAKLLDKEFWALSPAQLWAKHGHFLPVPCVFISLPSPQTCTSGSFILLENSSRHRLVLMRLCTGQVSMVAGLDVGFRYACNINDNDLKPICAKVML